MKKSILLLALVLQLAVVLAQAPALLNYQGVARNAVGNVLASKAITVRLSIHNGTAGGPVVYSETRSVTTNAFGLFNILVGSAGATIQTGTIVGISWTTGDKFIQSEIDPAGGNAFMDIGSAQLASVPFAMNAATATPTGNAGGDLSGTYPNPLVARLQGRSFSANAPLNGQFIKWNATNNAWEPATIASGNFALPFLANENSASTLFSINNAGTGTSVEGTSSSITANIAAVRGTISNTSAGGFSSGIRGINNGTGGLGIGVWGSHNGSGWGVYGITPDGIGVYGNASASGSGVFANSNTGIGIIGTSTNGIAANFSITNNANNNNVVNASTLGNGNVINVTASGGGYGVYASSTKNTGVRGLTAIQTGAGIIGDNTGGGEAVVGLAKSDIGGSVVGRNDGGGYGVRGFIATNASGNGIGVFGQIGLSGSTGRAGRFENLNPTNIAGNTLEVETNGNGNIPDNTKGNASSFLVNNVNSVGAAVRGEVKTIFSNFGAAGLFGVSSGTGGFAGLFHASNTSGNGPAVVAIADGNGNAITANAGKNGNGIETTVDGTGNSLYAWVPSFSTGRAGRFNNFNLANTSDVITVTNVGNGVAGNFKVDRTTGTSAAVKGEVNSIYSNFGTAGVYGISSGTGGYAGLFHASNTAGNGPAIIAIADGNGNAITANAGKIGDGIESSADGTGSAVYGWVPNFGTGRAGRFQNYNTANGNAVVDITNAGLGAALLVKHTGTAGNLAIFQNNAANVARIDKSGRGFFNGGTQVGGADIAEYFDVEGARETYEAGDVLVISTTSDRKVEKSNTPYSTLVSGVYATKPGVMLTEKDASADELDAMVPMGVIGVIPTKVCLEGGVIRRGDLIVTSSIPGVAMKADPDKVKIGQVIGKALADFNDQQTGRINVLVSIK